MACLFVRACVAIQIQWLAQQLATHKKWNMDHFSGKREVWKCTTCSKENKQQRPQSAFGPKKLKPSLTVDSRDTGKAPSPRESYPENGRRQKPQRVQDVSGQRGGKASKEYDRHSLGNSTETEAERIKGHLKLNVEAVL